MSAQPRFHPGARRAWHTRAMALALRIGLALGLALPPPAGAQSVADGYYAGTLRTESASALIGLTLTGDEARVDLISQWSLGLEVRAQRTPAGLALELPEGLGRVELGGARTLSGMLQRADGSAAWLELTAAPAPAVRAETLRFESDELTLEGTLGLPPGTGPHPALVLVPGGGDSHRDQDSTRFLAQYLPRFGFACLVYDKRGSGHSAGNWRTVGLEALARDALAAVESLRARTDIDPRRIGFFAASQGTWVALEACVRAPEHVAFVVNHSGPAVPLLEADTYALRASARAARLAPTEEEELVALWSLECAALREGVPPAEYEPLGNALKEAARRPWFARLPYQATPSDSWWVGWYPRVMTFDPRPRLEAVDQPMLWLYGACDTQSDVAPNVARLAELTRDARKPWSIHVFPGGNHGISVPLWPGADGPMTMADGYFETLLGWLARTTEPR